MIPRFQPPLGGREIIAALTPSFSDDVRLFEDAFAKVMEQGHAIAFPYGRSGLLALLKCLGLSNRSVICPAYTCVVVPNAVVVSGNRPVFVDSGRDANMDLDHVRGFVDETTGAILATSIFGNPVDLDMLDDLRAKHPHVPVIQDCAHSFITEWNSRPVHREGAAAIFGLNVSKTMTAIFGGMVTTDDAELASALREHRARTTTAPTLLKTMSRLAYAFAVAPAFWPPLFGLTDRLRRAGLLDRFTRYYDEELIELPDDHLVGMTGLEGRVGVEQTGRLSAMIEARRMYDGYYRSRLADVSGLEWLEEPHGSSVSHVVARVADRQRVRARAAAMGVELGEVIEYSVPDLAAYRSLLSDDRSFPVSAVLSTTVINLPTSLRFDERKAAKVVGVLRRVLDGAKPPPALPVT
ncbi:MAG: DegT/DnrJ/EryC1/StrS aminotransferase family protein [Roseitalea sp.]|jgi:dTDP-4-amino-4,6-dideoxygalactose transaminase|nr:DegT/DnrJ/EryC1/StrS aminotransferase family protein [Roseitalea sp.]MBO6722762.1 DegT/DnrJ/EryC1/StrS aminotransferase family protein [Roseitalea sp.]MBO6745164.1 DegT/DnrJ/EryC1/StrS aminotransferase family protein [Roseitalea sp.]